MLLWASPGSGKSTLLRQWVDRETGAGRETAILDARTPRDVVAALGSGATTVVIDNAEALDPAARDEVAQALETDAERRLIVAGRWDPFPVSPARWLVTRELRTSDLAFSVGETRALLERRGIGVDDDVAASLAERTAGWAAGLALACHVLASSDDPAAAATVFIGDDRAIGDYLLGEVLDTLTETERAVLVGAAVAPTVTPDLAVAATGHADAPQVLDRIARRNLLVERTPASGYSFHPVLRAYLAAESRHADPEGHRVARLRAARHLLAAGRPREALAQAADAGDGDAIAEVLRARGIELVIRGAPELQDALAENESDAATLLRRLLDMPYLSERAPTADQPLRPWDAASCAVARMLGDLGGDLVTIGPEPLPPSHDQVERAAATLATFVRVRERAIAARGDLDRVEALHRLALTAADDGYDWVSMLAIESAASLSLGTVHWRAAEAVLREAARQSIPPHVLATGTGSRLLLLGVHLAYSRCEPLSARSMRLLLSEDFARRHPFPARRGIAVAVLDAVDPHPTRESIERLDRFMADSPVHDPRFLSFMIVPWLSAATHHGNRPMLAHIVECARRAFGADAVECRLAELVQSPGRDAESELRDALADSAPTWDPATVTHAWVRLAVGAARRGATARATHDLTEAVMGAHYLDAIRPFVLFGGDVLPLLREHADRLGAWSATAHELLVRATEVMGETPDSLTVVLTARELELLDELPVHQTVADIARRQQVSQNTIKSQLKSVYRKLGVDNRADAVQAARRVGLLG